MAHIRVVISLVPARILAWKVKTAVSLPRPGLFTAAVSTAERSAILVLIARNQRETRLVTIVVVKDTLRRNVLLEEMDILRDRDRSIKIMVRIVSPSTLPLANLGFRWLYSIIHMLERCALLPTSRILLMEFRGEKINFFPNSLSNSPFNHPLVLKVGCNQTGMVRKSVRIWVDVICSLLMFCFTRSRR